MHNVFQVLFGTSSWKRVRSVHIQVLYLIFKCQCQAMDTQIQHANDWDFVASSGLCLYSNRSPVPNETLY